MKPYQWWSFKNEIRSLDPRVQILWPPENLRQKRRDRDFCQSAKYVLDLFSAYKYDQKADKVDFAIFENISFFAPSTSRGPPGGPTIFLEPKNHFNVHKMGKLELPNHFGFVLKIISTHIKRGSWVQFENIIKVWLYSPVTSVQCTLCNGQ